MAPVTRNQKIRTQMTISAETNSANLELADVERDQWARFKGRLRTNVGEDFYTSWFARMDLERIHDDCVHMTVPTKFLKSWIQAHYADRVLSCWQSEVPEVKRVELSVRTALRSVAERADVRLGRRDNRPALRVAHPPQKGHVVEARVWVARVDRHWVAVAFVCGRNTIWASVLCRRAVTINAVWCCAIVLT